MELRKRDMESIELSSDRSCVVTPKDGFVLMVRFKLADRNEFETLFCDYGLSAGRTLQMAGCRCKTFVMGQMPCDHAVQVGSMELALEHIADLFQLPTPPWYHRLEEDAAGLADAEFLALEVGVLDVFAEMTGT